MRLVLAKLKNQKKVAQNHTLRAGAFYRGLTYVGRELTHSSVFKIVQSARYKVSASRRLGKSSEWLASYTSLRR
jgi:hypothetical protein